MRIRKHAQRSQICCLPSQLPSPNPYPSGSSPTRICELNRSPWDVMSFIPEAMREDGFSGEESGGETSSAVGSISSSKGTWGEDDGKLKLKGRDISWSSISGKEMKSKSKSRKEGSFICCNKTDGKGWHCKKEAKRGHSLCEHHLSQLKSYYTNNKGLKSDGAPPAAAVVANNVNRGKRSSKKKMSSSSNYYYYTGFGPLWGKGKGRGEDNRRDMKVEVDSGPSSSTPSLSSRGDADDADNDDDDVEDEDSGGDDDDDGNFDRKKTRKPVKTRSLKSLF